MTSLSDEMFQAMMDWNPLFATLVGVPGWDDRLEDLSADGHRAMRSRLTGILERLDGSGEDPVARDVIRHQAESIITGIDARLVEHSVSRGTNAPVAGLLRATSHLDFSQRRHLVPGFLGQAADRLLDTDRRPLRRHVENGAAYVERFLASPRQEWEGDADLRPAFARYREVLLGLPGRVDEQAGLCWLPDGEENYRKLVRDYTTASYSPAELHRLGLDLIAGLHEEYAKIGSRVWGVSDVAEIFRRLRTDLLWDNEDEMLVSAVDAVTRAEAEAPNWFGRLPKARCEVRFVPEVDRRNAAFAYYEDAALDGSRPGTYFVNPLNATGRSRTVSEVTAFHEAVPGHHFQLSIAAETELSNVRKFAFIDSYIEGWGLYTERLADEMGLYSSDEARLGMLGLDAMRAGRLVVDTGLHALGWPRQQAIDYLSENTAMDDAEISSEVDRYIEAPGQALAYMVGRLEIQRVREEARSAMGDSFDIRAFHDLVLENGIVPLPTLGKLVSDWSGRA
ncbi:Uncharacterized conserved protein, DUF885 familyt [Lentzea waywayandensis]|uniref:Uncharacterized conserved protein, DUF885 familyt n=1 Tax=Lentzea waywayandensis TaxID=84724 RepID=A0A1I6F3C3_9PSEU|nr:DUF885 domain-containing protein [Lentzea waywayandensis]SFR24421.1 Uncharacterized conserved protein, DUF885 familyt [Lentzea waywayandensis]